MLRNTQQSENIEKIRHREKRSDAAILAASSKSEIASLCLMTKRQIWV